MNQTQEQVSYSAQTQAEALGLRLQGVKYFEISRQLNIPENTLKKWFAPSVNRHSLAETKEEQLQNLRKTSKNILEANVVTVTEKLTEMAIEGDIRAITEVLNRVHGKPTNEVTQSPRDDEDFCRSTAKLGEALQNILHQSSP